MPVKSNACREIYKPKYYTDETGRYIIKLSFKLEATFSEWRTLTLKQFAILERKLEHNPIITKQYTASKAEYLNLNHMQSVPDEKRNSSSGKVFYLPHRGALREDNMRTKNYFSIYQ